MARSIRSLGKEEARARRGQGKANVWLKQSNCNHNPNYNLMGFDIIEINLVKATNLETPMIPSLSPPV